MISRRAMKAIQEKRGVERDLKMAQQKLDELRLAQKQLGG
jgi:hypothetical protein